MIFIIASLLFAVIDPKESSPDLSSDVNHIGDFFEIPSSSYSFEDLEIIPGSKQSYYELYVDKGRTWNIYTNGVLAVTNETLSLIKNPITGGKYNLCYDLRSVISRLGLTPIELRDRFREWSPPLFEFRMNVYSNIVLCVSNADGSNVLAKTEYDLYLYQPRSFRYTDSYAAAIMSSYSAYFERLYYASEGNQKSYGPEWGPTEPSNMFPFNIANGEYAAQCYFEFNSYTGGVRSVPSARKILDRSDITSLQKKVLNEMLGTEAEMTYGTMAAHPGFIYRPGGILDMSNAPHKGISSRIWWASTANPPIIDIPPPPDGGPYQLPSLNGFGDMPTFPWTFYPIVEWVGGTTGYEQKFDWSTKCVTLSMAKASNVKHPIVKLFEDVGYDGGDLDDWVKPYRFSKTGSSEYSLFLWMTNIYPLAVSQYADKMKAFESYVDTSAGAARDVSKLRRILPNDYVGVNHLLAAMDRTYHIPSMAISSSNEVVHVSREGKYSGYAVPVDITVTADGEVTLEGTLEGEATLSRIAVTNGIDRYYTGTSSGLEMYATIPWFSSDNGKVEGEADGPIYLNEQFLAEIGDEGHNEVKINNISSNPMWPVHGPMMDVSYYLNGGTNRVHGLSATVYGHTGSLTLYCDSWSSYDYSQPISVDVKIGNTQPGQLGESLVSSSKAWLLSRCSCLSGDEDWPRTSPSNAYESVSIGGYSGRSMLVGSVKSSVLARRNSMKSLLMELNGNKNFENYDDYAPLDGSMAVEYSIADVDHAYFQIDTVAEDYKLIFEYPYYYTFQNPTNRFTFLLEDVSEYVIDVFHDTVTEIEEYSGSGYCHTNVYQIDVEDIVSYSRRTNHNYSSSQIINGTFRSGPHENQIQTVQVPHYTILIEDWYEVVTADYTHYNRNISKTVVMSGTGELDPGIIVSEQCVTNVVGSWNDHVGGPRYDKTVECPPTVTYVQTPVSSAIIKDGGPVEVSGFLMVSYDLNDGYVENKQYWVRYYNPVEGLDYDIACGIPQVGIIKATIEAECWLPSYVAPRGCETFVDLNADGKIMTRVDWNWKHLKRQ